MQIVFSQRNQLVVTVILLVVLLSVTGMMGVFVVRGHTAAQQARRQARIAERNARIASEREQAASAMLLTAIGSADPELKAQLSVAEVLRAAAMRLEDSGEAERVRQILDQAQTEMRK